MGQSLMKLGPGSEEKKIKEIIEEFSTKDASTSDKPREWTSAEFSIKVASTSDKRREWTSAEFYRHVCCTVEEINRKLGNTQLRVPRTDVLENAYHKHKREGESLTKEEFQKILEEVITDTGFTGTGAKDTLLYIFGVPVTALILKQRMMPAIPNEIFVPGITSVTVLILAMLNKM